MFSAAAGLLIILLWSLSRRLSLAVGTVFKPSIFWCALLICVIFGAESIIGILFFIVLLCTNSCSIIAIYIYSLEYLRGEGRVQYVLAENELIECVYVLIS